MKKFYYGFDLNKKREKLLKNQNMQKPIDRIISLADDALNADYEPFKASDYQLFMTTGNRRIFEDKYYQKRNSAYYLSVALWLTGDEKYIAPLTDLVFYICDEFTWCFPAHAHLETNPSVKDVLERIDLFSSLTGKLLTDIDALVGEILPYYVRQRIEWEVRRRLFTPLMEDREFWWEDYVHNWTSVCSSGTGIALIHYGTKEEIDKILPRLYKNMENFIDYFFEDGCCLEGYSYWDFGFGHFLSFARALIDYSNGKLNLMEYDREKIKKISQFPQNIRLTDQISTCFADGYPDYMVNNGNISYIREYFGDDIKLPPLYPECNNMNMHFLTELLWISDDYKPDELEESTVCYDQSQWYIKKNKKFGFATKGGFNNEPHNHNDVGSFMIAVGDSVPFADFGAGIYSNGTFDPKTRYTLLVDGSHGHSVPIINDKYQLFGAEYCAKNMKMGEHFVSYDIEDAYEKGIIDKLHREFKISDTEVLLIDTFGFSDKTRSVKERFVTYTKPKISNGVIDLESAKMYFDDDKYSATFKEDKYREHLDRYDVTVYLIDVVAKNDQETRFEFKIVI